MSACQALGEVTAARGVAGGADFVTPCLGPFSVMKKRLITIFIIITILIEGWASCPGTHRYCPKEPGN